MATVVEVIGPHDGEHGPSSPLPPAPRAAWGGPPPLPRTAWGGHSEGADAASSSESTTGGATGSAFTAAEVPYSSGVEAAAALTPLRRAFDPRDASLWDEQRGDPLPTELHRRLTAAAFSYPPPPLPCSPFARPYHGLRQALRRPPWHPATMRAKMNRVKTQAGTLFEFSLELPGYTMLVMAARKLTRSMTTYFAFSLERDVVQRDSPYYLGKLRATGIGGVEWVLFDHGLSQRDASGAEQHTRRVLLALSFERGTASPRLIAAATGPPQLLALVPGGRAPTVPSERAEDDLRETSGRDQIDYAVYAATCAPTRASPRQAPSRSARWLLLLACTADGVAVWSACLRRYRGASEGDGALLERWRRREAGDLADTVAALTSKQAGWNEQQQAYTLEFDGRAQRPSIKNVQLVESDASGGASGGSSSASAGGGGGPSHAPNFQMGKLGDNQFTVDWTTPLSPMAAFAIALALCECPSQISVALTRRLSSRAKVDGGPRGSSSAESSTDSATG